VNTLKRIIEQTDTSAVKVFALIIQTLILISLVTFSIETLPGLSESSKQLLRRIEIVTVAIFTVEYALRLLVADNKIRFVFSFFGIFDLLAILPFYISTGIDLRAIRSVRFLRLFRMLKMVRYSKAIRRFHVAFLIAKEELALFLAAALFLLYFAAVGIYYFENEVQPETFASVFHSLWWSVVTLTTVGYGDVVPITVGGRVFTFFVLAIGLGVVAVPAGLVASALSKAREMED